MPSKPDREIPRRVAERQEAVFGRLQALAREVQALARQRSGRPVPDRLRQEAEKLLIEARCFYPDHARAGLPVLARHCGGLAAQLADALTALMAFETRHTHWDALEAETLWAVSGAKMRVRRLQPRPGSKAAARAEAKARQAAERRAAYMVDLRAKLVQRLAQFRSREPAPSSAADPPDEGRA
jgi:hypothetical protein